MRHSEDSSDQKKMNMRGSKGMCGRKPVISSCWREQKEGGDKGMSERKECADRIKAMFHVPCCSHNICLGCSSGQECTAISSYKSVVIRLKEWKILLLVCNLKPITRWSSIGVFFEQQVCSDNSSLS